MENLEMQRKKIDEIDEKIQAALSERVQVCKSIGAIKRSEGTRVQDAKRELEVFEHVRTKAVSLDMNPGVIEAIYRGIVNMCSSVQSRETRS